MDKDDVTAELKPRERARRVPYKLRSIGAIVSELGATYRSYARGEISAQKAQVRKALLSELRQAVEGIELAKRLDEIEALVKGNDPSAPNLRLVK
jgi:hypothetical protein